MKPHIHREIFAALESRRVQVLHMDLKADDGVNIVGDIYDPAFQEEIRRIGAKLLMCCNILEHLQDPAEFARVCATLVVSS